MSIDFEDYFCDLPFSKWVNYKNRVMETTPLLLDLFSKYRVRATFFVVGYIAEKFPKLINEIQEHGHEIASHSYSHLDLRRGERNDVEKDIVKSFKIIEDVTGTKVKGFRAPFFSINNTNPWVFHLLRKHVKYDSSVFPVKSPLYGVPDAPRTIYRPSKNNFKEHDDGEDLIEIPPLTYRVLSFYNLPIAGGFYFRALPYSLIARGIRKFSRYKAPAVLYFHPKDLDNNMPRIDEYSWHYYYGKKGILNKFEKLLKDFEFTSIQDFLGLQN